MSDLAQEIRQFIINNCLFGEDDGKLSNDDSFMEQGIVDSTGVLELVAFIDGKYGFKIKNDEVIPENLDSVNKLIGFINRKAQLSTEAASVRA